MTREEDAEREERAPIRRRGLREGYTTGACATAAAKAATIALLTGRCPQEVTICLPIGREVTFPLHRCSLNAAEAFASVIKDAGDDPDVTHGAEICAKVKCIDGCGVILCGGVGVGTVTKPGLGLEVGGPAINPVPRRMITEAVTAVAGDLLQKRALRVEISVPNGEQLAKRTLNARLGIIGGLSILGTTGIVKPYSTAAYRASVEQGIDVAAANGHRWLVLSTGGRSERFAQALFKLPEMAFVEMGEFTGAALKRCRKNKVTRVTLAGMIGKFSKLAQGHFMTHVAGNKVDTTFLAELAAQCGAPHTLQVAIKRANTARHVQELVIAAGLTKFFDAVCTRVVERCAELVDHDLAVEAVLFDFDGHVLGRAASGLEGNGGRHRG